MLSAPGWSRRRAAQNADVLPWQGVNFLAGFKIDEEGSAGTAPREASS